MTKHDDARFVGFSPASCAAVLSKVSQSSGLMLQQSHTSVYATTCPQPPPYTLCNVPFRMLLMRDEKTKQKFICQNKSVDPKSKPISVLCMQNNSLVWEFENA